VLLSLSWSAGEPDLEPPLAPTTPAIGARGGLGFLEPPPPPPPGVFVLDPEKEMSTCLAEVARAAFSAADRVIFPVLPSGLFSSTTT
jgi:hypothetical protein